MISPLTRVLIMIGARILDKVPNNVGSDTNNIKQNKKLVTEINYLKCVCPNCGYVNSKRSDTPKYNYICSSCSRYFDTGREKEKEKEKSLKAHQKAKAQEALRRHKITNIITIVIMIVLSVYVIKYIFSNY